MFDFDWQYLIGLKEKFSLEKRVFHGTCLIASVVLILSIPSTFFLGLSILSYVFMFLLLIVFVLYYFSRFKNHSKIVLALYITFIYFVLIVGYLVNWGINGPIIMAFGITFLILSVAIKNKYLFLWMIVHLIVANLLLYLEYHFPNIIFVHYENRLDRFLDTGLAISILVVSIFFTIRFLKLNYEQEQKLSNDKNEALILANATKDRLFSIISHDLRSPFNSLINLSQMLKENGAELPEEEKTEFIDAIYETSTKTYLLLQNLLEWSLSQSNEIQFLPKEVNIYDCVNRSLFMPAEIAKNKDIEIINNLPLNQTVWIDENMMETVFRNLVTNAIKFTNSNGTITISSKQEHDGVLIEVTDTGIGMDEATASALFDTKNHFNKDKFITEKGMGLGLMLCKDFVQKHDGKIGVKSELGLGSTFFVFLKNK